MTTRRKFGRRDDGQALVEFALTLPILMFLLLGIVDFARAWNVYEVLTDAGREATRLAVVDVAATDADIRQVAKDALGRTGIALADQDITIDAGAARGDPTTVTINYGYELKWIGWAMGLLGADKTLNFSVASTMRRE